jgi:hypothetical protein
MPRVNIKADLEKIYAKAVEKIKRGEIPTTFIEGGQVLYRSIDPQSRYTLLPKLQPAPTYRRAWRIAC